MGEGPRASRLVAAGIALTLVSIPLLLGGVGVVGIAGGVVLLGAARLAPGYLRVRWIARGFALLCLAVEVGLHVLGRVRGTPPSTVDWILLALALAMVAVTLPPVRASGPLRAA